MAEPPSQFARALGGGAEAIEISSEKEAGPSSATVAAAGDVPDDRVVPPTFHAMWGPHTGFGLCTGSNQLPCYFGLDGTPTNAGPDGRCDLCSADALAGLHDGMQQRITHLLTQLTAKPLQHALIRIGEILGPEARADYKMRRDRALKKQHARAVQVKKRPCTEIV